MTTISASTTAGIKIRNPGYQDGVYTAQDLTTAFTVKNNGTISGSTTSSVGVGLNLKPGGSVTNAGLIRGNTGVRISGGTGNLVNSGTIKGGNGTCSVVVATTATAVIIEAGATIANPSPCPAIPCLRDQRLLTGGGGPVHPRATTRSQTN